MHAFHTKSPRLNGGHRLLNVMQTVNTIKCRANKWDSISLGRATLSIFSSSIFKLKQTMHEKHCWSYTQTLTDKRWDKRQIHWCWFWFWGQHTDTSHASPLKVVFKWYLLHSSSHLRLCDTVGVSLTGDTDTISFYFIFMNSGCGRKERVIAAVQVLTYASATSAQKHPPAPHCWSPLSPGTSESHFPRDLTNGDT